MEERKCPHLQIHYRENRNYNSHTGKLERYPDGWYCDWCNQEFVAAPERKAEKPFDPLGPEIEALKKEGIN